MSAVSTGGASSAPGNTAGNTGGAFNPKIIIGLIVAGALALLAYLILTAFGPQFSDGKNGGGHALSNSAVGYSALVDMVEAASDTSALVSRDPDTVSKDALLIVTPETTDTPDEVKEIVDAHLQKGPVLIVLPKWITARDELRGGWVRRVGEMPRTENLLPLDDWGITLDTDNLDAKDSLTAESRHFGEPLTINLPKEAKVIECDDCTAAFPYADGKLVVAETERDNYIYFLAESDLLNNQGIAKREQGLAALKLINGIAYDSGASSIAFDVTLNGFGKTRSILRFLFEPPFLAVTLCLIAAAVLAAWQAFHRFGPALQRVRDVALGKTALITNGAELMRQAGKERHGASVYARHMRDKMGQSLKAPGHLEGEALDHWLDRFTPPGRPLFSEMIRSMILADNDGDMVRIGAQLSRWRKEVLREH